MLTASVSIVQSDSNIDSHDGENLRVLLPPLQRPFVSLLKDTESRIKPIEERMLVLEDGEVFSLSRSPAGLVLGTLVVSETKDEAKSELVRTLGPLRDFSQDNENKNNYNSNRNSNANNNNNNNSNMKKKKKRNSPQVTLDSEASSPDSTILPIDSPPVTRQLDERCFLPKKQGSCFALFTRYAFDSKTKKCHEFIYSGCNGNGNNFEQPEECVKACNALGITKLAISIPIEG